ncbi:circadian clock-controlled protein [Apis mellifera]|uniref:Circadian clock-controlled protein n=1 Tax=Apis mellifera TaxID=7460 RepID=A0A7M7R6C9_APIME|nr:circadian clock-controlled protein [Apis mellifera]|eukprot:XP_393105.4 circadian clock-controlled protein [Apis mellifera]
MSFQAVVVAALCAATLVLGDYQLPATVKTCKRDSDDFSSCLRLAIQEAWPTFVPGLPEFDIPPLDPYYTESYSMEHESGQLRGKISIADVRLYGLAKSRFLSVKPEMDGDFFRLEIDVEIPKLLIDGDYKAEGSLATFKMGGKGFFNISMENIRTVWDISGHVVNDRWVVKHFKTAPTISSMKVWFSDLFNGNEELNRAALVFINEYWPLVYRTMLPKLIEMWDTYLSEFSNRFFSKIPFSTIFP